MSLKPCKECGRDVSQWASKCPECGISNPTVSAATCLGCLLVPLLFIGGCIFLAAVSAKPWDERDNSTMAYIMMEDEVKRRLKSPSTADFPGVLDGFQDHVKRLPNQKYLIDSYVDSQNTFGAVVRAKFIGVIQQVSEENWELEYLDGLD